MGLVVAVPGPSSWSAPAPPRLWAQFGLPLAAPPQPMLAASGFAVTTSPNYFLTGPVFTFVAINSAGAVAWTAPAASPAALHAGGAGGIAGEGEEIVARVSNASAERTWPAGAPQKA